MQTVQWFKRLADVPGLSYTGSQTINRTKLPGHDLEPEVLEFEYGGELHRDLSWPMPDGGSTSASPVHQRVYYRSGEDATPQETLRRLEETLELPGELSDYHFAIQGVCEAVYKRRREDLSLLEETERLCWLDIELIEAYPETVATGHEEMPYAHVVGYKRLVTLYEGEGYFREALEVAQRGFRIGQKHLSQDAERLRFILQELEAEGVGR